jgi:hypothetical protein
LICISVLISAGSLTVSAGSLTDLAGLIKIYSHHVIAPKFLLLLYLSLSLRHRSIGPRHYSYLQKKTANYLPTEQTLPSSYFFIYLLSPPRSIFTSHPPFIAEEKRQKNIIDERLYFLNLFIQCPGGVSELSVKRSHENVYIKLKH